MTVIATAGTETTTRLIGWAGKTLAEIPISAANLPRTPALIPRAIEEFLRWEPPALQIGPLTSPATSSTTGRRCPRAAMLMLVGAANRDHRRFAPDGDVFDIHRGQPVST